MKQADFAAAERLRLCDGRTLAYRCFGSPGGAPVHVLHGFPGSSLQAALLHDAAVAAGAYLVAADRPGFGSSTHRPGRRIADFADDLAQLADHLGQARFAVLGISCGGAYALACAQHLPARVTRVALLAGIGPMDRPELRSEQLPALRLLFSLARWHEWLAIPLLALDRSFFLRDPVRATRALARMLTRPDQDLLERAPEVLNCFAESLAEAYRPGLAGICCEASLIARPQGIDHAAVTQPVVVVQSGQDRHVPPPMGRWLASHLPMGSLSEYRDAGHLSVVVEAGERVLRGLVEGPVS